MHAGLAGTLDHGSDRTELFAGGSLQVRIASEGAGDVIVEHVQRGVRSCLYQRGCYSPAREQGVHHFHRRPAGALTGR